MKSKFLIAAALAVLALSIAAGVWFYFSSTPSQMRPIAESYYAALCENNLDKALAMIMFAGNSQNRVVKDAERAAKTCTENGGFSGISLTEEKITGDKASLRGSVIHTNGSKTPFVMQLMQVGDEWKIIIQ